MASDAALGLLPLLHTTFSEASELPEHIPEMEPQQNVRRKDADTPAGWDHPGFAPVPDGQSTSSSGLVFLDTLRWEILLFMTVLMEMVGMSSRAVVIIVRDAMAMTAMISVSPSGRAMVARAIYRRSADFTIAL